METVRSATGTLLLRSAGGDHDDLSLLDAALRLVNEGDGHVRPQLYELAEDGVVLIASQPIVLAARAGTRPAPRIELRPDQLHIPPGCVPPSRVPLLVEVAAAAGHRAFADPIAASVLGIGGTTEEVAAFTRSIADAACTAGVEVIGLRGESTPPRLAVTISCHSIAEVLAYLGPRTADGHPAIVIVDRSAAAGDDGELVRCARAHGVGVIISRLEPTTELALVLPEPPQAYLRAFGRARSSLAARSHDGGNEQRVEVAILGPTEVSGIDGSLVGRPRLTELVVYLAMHPEGSGTRSWSAALWPERRVPAQTIANRLSEARRLLGFAPDGLPRLRRSGERHLIADVVTDWSRFCTLSASDADPDSWARALGLIRGRTFDDLAQGNWTVLEGFVGEIEQAIVDCGLRLGEYCLVNHDHDGAAKAAQLAIRASPWDERLHRLLMRAADAAGNRSGVEEIFRHLGLALEVDGNPIHSVHPETAALYVELSGRSAHPAVP